MGSASERVWPPPRGSGDRGMTMERREFLRGMAGAGAGLALGASGAEGETARRRAPLVRSGQPADVAVVKAPVGLTLLHVPRSSWKIIRQ